jgi:hypothetical protein
VAFLCCRRCSVRCTKYENNPHATWSKIDEIHELQDTELQYKERITTLAQEKINLFETCHTLTAENTDLNENNKRLVEINTRLLKEKLDLTKAQQKLESSNEAEIRINPEYEYVRSKIL